MVNREIDFHLQNYKTSGAELIMGTGRFVAPKTLEVRLNDGGTRVLAGDQVFLNVGTHAVIPSVPGLEAAGPPTHLELWSTILDGEIVRPTASGRNEICRECCEPRYEPDHAATHALVHWLAVDASS